MYHISDVKKYTRCPRLYVNEKNAPRREYQLFVRLDEEVTTLVAEKLHITDRYFLGQKGDEPQKALDAMQNSEWLMKARFEYKQLRVKVPFFPTIRNSPRPSRFISSTTPWQMFLA